MGIEGMAGKEIQSCLSYELPALGFLPSVSEPLAKVNDPTHSLGSY